MKEEIIKAFKKSQAAISKQEILNILYENKIASIIYRSPALAVSKN